MLSSSILPLCISGGKDKIIKYSLLAAPLLLLFLTVACQAETLTRRYIVELQQDAAFSNQSFSIKPDQRLLSDNPSDIADKNNFITPDLASDYKRQSFFSYKVKTTLIESISWQLLYATNLLVAFELIMTSKAPPLGATSYSWLPIEEIATVGWLLKNYWNPYSALFKLIEQSEIRLTQGNQPFAITTMMHGSGYEQQQPQSQLPESSDQQAPQTTRQPTSAFTNPLSSGSGDGFRDPKQHAHTLGLDCFVHPCHGVCKFRSSSENMGPAERSLKSEESLASHSGTTPEQNSCPHNCLCYRCVRHSDPANETSNNPIAIQLQWAFGQPFQVHDIDDNPANTTPSPVPVPCNLTILEEDGQLRNCEKVYKSVQSLLNHKRQVHTGQKTCLTPVVGEDGLLRPCGKVCKNLVALSNHRRSTHTGQQTCNVIMVTEDGRERLCGKVCKSGGAMSSHKKNVHSRQRTCGETVVGEDGQLRPCGKLFRSTQSLSTHKYSRHTGQKTCDMPLVREDGRQWPCGTVCKSNKALSDHKRGYHSGQKICEVIVIGEDGKQQPCGRVCKNAYILSSHKQRHHSEQKTCDVIVADEDRQQRPCGKVCKSVQDLSCHKSRYHCGQQTCNAILVSEDGQQRPCGTVCKNKRTLSGHRRSAHTGQQTCDVTMVGEDGQPQPCGKVYKNVNTFSKHKRTHRKRKPVDTNQKDTLSTP